MPEPPPVIRIVFPLICILFVPHTDRMIVTNLSETSSQKMLTKTLRQMEADGLVLRTVFPVIPPRVAYGLTYLGRGLGEAFRGVWIWAAASGRHDGGARNLDPSRSDLREK